MKNPGSKAESQVQHRARLRWLAVLIGIAPLILLELGLRLFGVGTPSSSAPTPVGFDPDSPVFERLRDRFETSITRIPFLPEQSFAAEKPADGFRVFCFGGSTVHGRPYAADTAFPKWLEIELATTSPDRTVEVVNCGGISYASFRIVPMVREVMQYQPDVIVVATGHNEFLEDRTYQDFKRPSPGRRWIERLAGSLRLVTVARAALLGTPSRGSPTKSQLDSQNLKTRLDETTGYASYHRDEAWRERVLQEYEGALEAIADICRDRGVPLVLVKLGANLRDCPPYKSEHRNDLSAVEEQRWRLRFESATRADQEGDWTTALLQYRECEALDDAHALLHYRIANCLDRIGRYEEAATHYRQALEEDVCPLRILSRAQNFQEAFAGQRDLPLVDAANLLEAASKVGIPGYDWYLDHVHPSISGHQEIARALAATFRESALMPNVPTWSNEERQAAFARHFAGLSPAYFPNGRRRVEWLEDWAQRQRLLEETRPRDADDHLRAGFRALDFADYPSARKHMETALQENPDLKQDLARHLERLRAGGRTLQGMEAAFR